MFLSSLVSLSFSHNKTNLRSGLQLAADILRLGVFLNFHTCSFIVCHNAVIARCTSLSLLMLVLPVPSNCRGDFTHIQRVILDPPPRPVSSHPSLPPSQPIPCFCFPSQSPRTTSSCIVLTLVQQSASPACVMLHRTRQLLYVRVWFS